MAKQYAPHIERLLAVAASGKLLAVGGRRDAAGVTDSSVHLLQLPKLNARFSAPLDAAVSALAFCGDDCLLAGTAKGDLAIWRTSGDGKKPAWQSNPKAWPFVMLLSWLGDKKAQGPRDYIEAFKWCALAKVRATTLEMRKRVTGLVSGSQRQ